MYSVLTTLIHRLGSGAVDGAEVIPWSCPIPSFGDPYRSRVGTLGINPSNREFVDRYGNELEGTARRLHTLHSVTVPRAVWNFEWSLKGRILPGTFAENQAAINSPRSRPSSPLHTHCVSPSPFNIPSVLLYPLSVLYLILLLPIVRSVQLLVCGIPLNR